MANAPGRAVLSPHPDQPPFGLRFGSGGSDAAQSLHFVARGPVFLRGADDTVHAMATGDAVLLPRGSTHDRVSSPDLPGQHVTALESVPICQSVDAIQACRDSANDPAGVRVIFSGCMEFDLGSACIHLVALMPNVMFVGTLLERYPEILPMLEAMEREARGERARLCRNPGAARRRGIRLHRQGLGGMRLRRCRRLDRSLA